MDREEFEAVLQRLGFGKRDRQPRLAWPLRLTRVFISAGIAGRSVHTVGLTEQQVSDLLGAIDVDGSGTIEYNEVQTPATPTRCPVQ